MGDSMNDDLGRHLRDEVPPPRAGYWESIDASLEDISEETSDTGDMVVRPIGMNERRNDLSIRLMAIAAAVAVIAAAGVFIATRNDGSTETDIATEVTVDGGPTTTVDNTAVDNSADGNGSDTTVDGQETVTTIEAIGFPSLPEGTERRCYTDFVLNDWLVVAEFDADGTVRAASVDTEGQRIEVSTGQPFGADGWHVMTSESSQGERYVTSWFITDDSLTQAEDAFYEVAECSPDNGDLVRAASAAQAGIAPAEEREIRAERVCFVGEVPGSGGEAMRIDINADGTATMVRRLDVGEELPAITYGSGFLVEEGSFAFDVTNAQERITEIYSLINGGADFGLGFFFAETLCEGIAEQFQDVNGLDAADYLMGFEFRSDTTVEASAADSVVASNAVISGEADRITVQLGAGQAVDFSLTSLEDNAVFDIIGPGLYFFADEVQSFSTQVPLTGEYQIIVSSNRGNATYDLTITVS